MVRSAVLAGCAIFCMASADPLHAEEEFALPPYQGVYEPQGTDERGLWMLMDEFERDFRDSDLVIRDEALNDYVRSVLCKTVGEERCRNVRSYIARGPRFNAFMAPNGFMIINSGLLLRARSEDDLAVVLAHEFAHFERRHSLARFRRARSATDAVAWLGIASIASLYIDGSDYTDIAGIAGILVLGGYFAFSRKQERQADILGLSYLLDSDYRPQAASEMWVRLMDESDASAKGRNQRSRRYDRTPFFLTHPTHRERAGYLAELAEGELSGRVDNVSTFEEAIRPWRPVFLEDQIRLNDFGGSEYLLGQLAERLGWTAELLYFRGELFRMRGHPRDLVNAAEFYRQSIALDQLRPEAFRGLGLSLMRARAMEEGREALEQYLKMEPESSDAAMIQALVGQSR